MEVSLIAVHKSEFESVRRFLFDQHPPTSQPSLQNIMPIDKHLSYGVIISDATIKSENKYYDCKDFNAFFEAIGLVNNETNLHFARANFQIIEGHHQLPFKIKQYIEANSGLHIYIRCWENSKIEYTWKADSANYLSSDDFIQDLPCNIGEFEIFDENCNWYLRATDDDPFIFLAVEASVLQSMLAEAEKHIMALSKDFLYRQ
jgi:hypothetical protein